MCQKMSWFACLGLILFCTGCGDLTPPDRKPVNPLGIVTEDLNDMAKPVKQAPPPAAPAKQTPAAPGS